MTTITTTTSNNSNNNKNKKTTNEEKNKKTKEKRQKNFYKSFRLINIKGSTIRIIYTNDYTYTDCYTRSLTLSLQIYVCDARGGEGVSHINIMKEEKQNRRKIFM